MKAWLRCKYPVGMRLGWPGWVSGVLLMLTAAGALLLLTSALRISGVWVWSRQPVQALAMSRPTGALALAPGLKAAVQQVLDLKYPGLTRKHRSPAVYSLLATPGQQLMLTATHAGVRLYLDQGAAVDVRLVAVNTGARDIAPGYTEPDVHGDRVRIQRGSGLVEWYASGASGIEQGFSLAQALSKDAATTRLQLQLGGALQPVLTGNAVEFKDASGHVLMTYGRLLAYDAGHRRLPAHLALQDRRLSLIVDTRDAAYPITIDPVFAASDLLSEPTPALNHQFGYAVAISSNGSVALVGAPGATTAYVFTYSSGAWSSAAALPDPSAKASDEFGQAVALSADGTYALVGAPGAGKAYLFNKTGATWNTASPRVFADPQAIAGDDFGGSVALSADGATVLIGAEDATAYTPAASTKDPAASAGRAYAYSSASWSNAAVFQQPTPAAHNGFGFSVALASGTGGDTALIGAPQATVYVPSPTSKSAPPTAVSTAGGAYVYQFSYSGGKWSSGTASPSHSLSEPVPTMGDEFGYAVSLSSDGTAGLVGAPYAAVTSNGGTVSDAGKAYQYTGGTWSTPLEFDDPGATAASGQGSAANDNFGWALSLSPDDKGALIGAPGAGVLIPSAGTALPAVIADAGEMYAYSVARGSWPPQAASLARPQAFSAPGEVANSLFGSSAAASAASGTPAPLVNGLAGGPLLSVKPSSAQTLAEAGSVLALYTAADLSLSVIPPTSPVNPGGAITYDFTVTNNDTSVTATNVKLRDALPAGVSYGSSSDGSGGSCANSGGTVTCTLASLGPKAVWQPSITVMAPSARTMVSNTPAVSADQRDSNTANNTVAVTTGVAQLPVASTSALTAYVSGAGQLSGTVQSGQTKSYVLSTQAAHGTVTVNSSGSYAYTASPSYLGTLSAVCGGGAGSSGSDSFQFEVSDGTYTSSPATVAVTVYPGPTACPPSAAIVAHGTLPQAGQLTGLEVAGSGQSLTYGVAAQPSHGTVQVTPGSGAFTYTPGGNYNGPDAFTFSVSDQYGNSSTATVNITDYAAPTVNNAAFTLHGTAGNLSLELTGTEPDPAQVPAINITVPPGHGTVTPGTVTTNNGTFTVPFTYISTDPGYTGSDSFSFTATDAYNTSNTGIVTLTVYTPPVANGGTLIAHVTASGAVTATDSDPTQQLVYTITAPPAHGKLTTFNTSTGAFTYQADAGYSGADSFQFNAKDSYATSNTATVSITDFAAPVAGNGSLTVHTAASGTLQATDPDTTQTLSYSLVNQPAHGVVTLNAATGAYTYKSAAGYTGSDSFSFNASDSYNTSNTATVTVVDYAAPTAGNSTLVVHAKASGILTASDPDSSQTLTYSVVRQPQYGTLSLDAGTGAYSYVANTGYTGSDSFTFNAHDSFATSNTAAIALTVFAAPVAADATLAVHGSGSGTLVATDADSRQTLTYAIVIKPAHGTLSLDAASGAYSYTADGGYTGKDGFTFSASDSYNTSNGGVVSITDYAPPTATGSVLTATENGTAAGQLQAVDPDPAQTLAYAVVLPPTHGQLSLNSATGTYVYAPASGFSGSDSFSFTVKDAYATSNTANVAITVAAAASPGGSSSGGSTGTPQSGGPPAAVAPGGGGGFGWLGLLLLAALAGLRRRRAA